MKDFRHKRRFQLVEAKSEPKISTWTTQQEQVFACSTQQRLVLGGPGTGKTTTLIEDLARQVTTAASSLARVIVVTHSRERAQQLRVALVSRLGGASLAPRVTTMHGLALALVRRYANPEVWGELSLLRAPEQEFRLRELLAGYNTESWPPELAAAASTRLLSSQLRTILSRARQLGLDPSDLQTLTKIDPIWDAVGDFFEHYLTVLDFEGAIDYAELVHRARLLLVDDQVRSSISTDVEAIYCDEFAELDHSQLRLLGEFGELGLAITAFADPQQTIYGFRGASGGAVGWFREQFPQAAEIHLIDNCRAGQSLVSAWSAVNRRIDAKFAPIQTTPKSKTPGSVRAMVYDNAATELTYLVDELRRAHLIEGIPWEDFAVIVRTGRGELNAMGRGLRQHGIPVDVSGDEIALAEEQAVRPLLLALSTLENDQIDLNTTRLLLSSPLARLTTVELRAIGRWLRTQQTNEGYESHFELGQLLSQALCSQLALPETDPGKRFTRLVELLASARTALKNDATVHEIIWILWSGTEWPAQLQAAALDGDLSANAGLDAIKQLFEIAISSDHFIGARGLAAFIHEVNNQLIPVDTGRESDPRGRGVRLLTAHRAKGQQFPRVFVAGLQEGNWPKLVKQNSLLDPELLDELGSARSSGLIANERRLFYVAISRATDQLMVSGHCGTADEEERPSRFLSELGVTVERIIGRSARPMTLPGMVGELRRISCDPEAELGLRQAAAWRIAKLAQLKGPQGRQVVPSAEPDRWWGVPKLTTGVKNVSELKLSGTDIGSILECPRKWFLSRKVRADPPRNSAASIGTLIHLLAQRALQDNLSQEQVLTELDQAWDAIQFEANWLSAAEKDAAQEAIARLFAWQQAHSTEEVLGVEVGFEIPIEINGHIVHLTGSVDRLERDVDGRLRIVDFKTSRRALDAKRVATHEQLGSYQLAVRSGAFDKLAPGSQILTDAELVFLRVPHKNPKFPKVLRQPSLDQEPGGEIGQPTWVHQRLAEAVEILTEERYEARLGDACRYCPYLNSCPVIDLSERGRP